MVGTRKAKILLISIIFVLLIGIVTAQVITVRYPAAARERLDTPCAGVAAWTTQCNLNVEDAWKVCDAEGQFEYVHTQPGVGVYPYNGHFVDWDDEIYCRGSNMPDYQCQLTSEVDFLSSGEASQVITVEEDRCAYAWACELTGGDMTECGYQIGECPADVIPTDYPLSLTIGYPGTISMDMLRWNAIVELGVLKYHLCTLDSCPPEGACLDPGEVQPEDQPPMDRCPIITYDPWTIADQEAWQTKNYDDEIQRNTNFMFKMEPSGCRLEETCEAVTMEQIVPATGMCCGASFARQGVPNVKTVEVCEGIDYVPLAVPDRYPYTLAKNSPNSPDTTAIDDLISSGKVFYARCNNPSSTAECDMRPWTDGEVQEWENKWWSYNGFAQSRCSIPWTYTATECNRLAGLDYPQCVICSIGNWDYRFFEQKVTCETKQVNYDPDYMRDCGLVVGSNICAEKGNNQYEWATLIEEQGYVFDYSCSNASVLSAGNNFYGCGDTTFFNSTLPELTYLSVRRDNKLHGYLCAEYVPSLEEGYKGIIECTGDEAPIDKWPKQSIKEARAGDAYSPNLLYASDVDGSSVTRLQGQYNVDPAQGLVTLKIEPTWDGSDVATRTFFSIDEDKLGTKPFVRVSKLGQSIHCISGTSAPLTFDISGLESGELIEVEMRWGDAFSCKVNGEYKSR